MDLIKGKKVKIKSYGEILYSIKMLEYHPGLLDEMISYAGQKTRIIKGPFQFSQQSGLCCFLKIDGCRYLWHVDWLEPCSKIEINDSYFKL